jgi:GDP-4-dehydro-6-deoxy-D-mannose reductase
MGTHNLLAALTLVQSTRSIVVCGSSAEYGASADGRPVGEDQALRPVSDYGCAKAAQGLVASSFALRGDLHVTRVRTFNLVGPGCPDSLVGSALAKRIASAEQEGRRVVFADGKLNAVRDFTDVRDAVRAYWLISGLEDGDDVFNVCSGGGTSIREVASILIAQSPVVHYVHSRRGVQEGADIDEQVGTFRRLEAATGWRPVISIRESLTDMLQEWRERV